MRRTQVVVLELRPGVSEVEVGTLICQDPYSADVLGWIVQAAAPVDEP